MKIEISEEADRSQMIFDWIVTHLRLQGRKSAKFVEYKDVCMYRHVLTDGTSPPLSFFEEEVPVFGNHVFSDFEDKLR